MYKLWHLVTYPLAIILLIGYLPLRILGLGWDTKCLMLAMCIIGNWVAIYILIAAAIDMFRAQAYEMKVTPPERLVSVKNMNPEYALSTVRVQVDVERAFARAVMEMWHGPMPINLTENYWIKKGHWQKLGGTSRDQFVDMLERWVRVGAIARRNPGAENSPYKVASKRLVAEIAGGRKV